MEFTFLGTSSGVPTLQRNVTGLVVKFADSKRWCLVDCGEGTQHQLLRTPYSLVQLDAIFITHVHGDHSYGLPGLVASAAMAGRTEDLLIIAPRGIEQFLRTTIACTDMHLPYDIHFVGIETMSNIKLTSGFKVSTVELSHRVPSYAFCFDEIVQERHLDTEKLEKEGVPRGELWGQILKNTRLLLESGNEIDCEEYILPMREARRFIVGGDNDTPELLREACNEVQMLIHESTYTQEICDKVGPGPQHCSAKRLAEFAESVGVPNLILTHFSARYHHPDKEHRSSISAVEEEAKTYYSGKLFLAEDLASFQLTKKGDLELKQN